jgi:Glycosyl transferase family 2
VKVRWAKRAKTHSGIFVFAMVYNEEWFLPHFLDHHRRLGVDYFIFYDDYSTDRTREILLEQDDCAILAPGREAEETILHGVWLQRWLNNRVPENEGPGRWGLVLDADEFLVLPSRFSSVGDAITYLEQRKLSCALAPMVDFYPQRLSERFYDPLPPLVGSRWFDRDPGFVRIPGRPNPKMVLAGIRARLLVMLTKGYPHRIKEIYGDKPYRIAKLWKVPLLKTGEGIARPNAHDVSVEPPDEVQLALAHFKFFPELDLRVQEALSRDGHFQGGVEYRFLQAVLELFPDEELVCPASVEYRSPDDLERVGLIWAK